MIVDGKKILSFEDTATVVVDLASGEADIIGRSRISMPMSSVEAAAVVAGMMEIMFTGDDAMIEVPLALLSDDPDDGDTPAVAVLSEIEPSIGWGIAA